MKFVNLRLLFLIGSFLLARTNAFCESNQNLEKGDSQKSELFKNSKKSLTPPLTSLCRNDETVLFSCERKGKTFSLCASKDIDTYQGYIQYRTAKGRQIEMEFPNTKTHPLKIFKFSMLPRGSMVSFENLDFQYVLSNDLNDQSMIKVLKSGKEVSSFECVDTNVDSNLTMTSVQNLLKSAGLVQPN